METSPIPESHVEREDEPSPEALSISDSSPTKSNIQQSSSSDDGSNPVDSPSKARATSMSAATGHGNYKMYSTLPRMRSQPISEDVS